jgi:hypothetical protein
MPPIYPARKAAAAHAWRHRGRTRTCEITILDLVDNVASVKVVSEPFIDYLHLARLEGRWTALNALYEDRQVEGWQPGAP